MSFLIKEIKSDHATLYRIESGNRRIGLLGWFTMYLTGAVLFILVLSHLGAGHYFSTPQTITLAGISQSLKSHVSLRIIDIGLLVFCIVHGLVGLRRIILDLEIMGKTTDRYLAWGFTVIGVGLFHVLRQPFVVLPLQFQCRGPVPVDQLQWTPEVGVVADLPA